MHPTLDRLEKLAVVPTLVVSQVSDLEHLAEALVDGGLPCAEVTLRSPKSMESLRRIAAHPDNLLVGAGTVMNIQQADESIDAGAQFIVSPGIDAALIKHCQSRNIPIIPAASTASEVMQAVNLGLDCVKFFPSDALGGLPFIKALHGPFPHMRFMPTGGINRESMNDYLAFPAVLAVGGSWMVRKEWLDNDRYDIITNACSVTVHTLKLLRRGPG